MTREQHEYKGQLHRTGDVQGKNGGEVTLHLGKVSEKAQGTSIERLKELVTFGYLVLKHNLRLKMARRERKR